MAIAKRVELEQGAGRVLGRPPPATGGQVAEPGGAANFALSAADTISALGASRQACEVRDGADANDAPLVFIAEPAAREVRVCVGPALATMGQ